MSNKSGCASQVISLPAGGGAQQGIGESFAPDLFTGTGNLTVPIVTPPGRDDMSPTLNLVYSTGNGNGPFGLGWALSTPEISRRTSRGVPRYLDDAADGNEPDTFLLAGSDDLVPVGSPEAGVTRFRPRTEGEFARIDHVRESADQWRVSTRDGLVSRYGPDAVVTDPRDPSRIFCWKLAETTDPFGNRLRYDYRRDRADDGSRAWDQLYLEKVRYVDLDGGAFLISVGFVYEERPDPFSVHRSGFEVRTRLRCRRIEIRIGPGVRAPLTRSYELVYLDDRVRDGELASSMLPRNGSSMLSRIRVVGHDGSGSQELPPLEFGYSGFDPQQDRPRPLSGTGDTLPRRSLADDDLELVSLFGNGLPDIVAMNGNAQFWRNLGNGLFDAPRSMPEVPVDVRLGAAGTQFADLNGNGRADLLTLDRGGYFPLSFAGRWKGFVRYRRAPSVPVEDRNLRLVDLTGDGVVDALRTGPQFELFLNDPVLGWDVESRPRGPLPDFPDVNFDNPRVKLADLTGDGLQDIVLVDQRRIDYWPYYGHGRWGRRITMADSPLFDDRVLPPGRFDPRRVLFGDVDGDGLDDIVYIEPGRVTIWINQGGNGWSRPIVVDDTPAFPDIDAVRLVDLLGTGSAGILWTGDAPARHQFLDLTDGVKPYLLQEITNNIGAVTRIGYASSTTFYLADQHDPAERPGPERPTPWQTPLPFPVQVVARAEVIDEFSRTKHTTSYSYHHGYFDGAEREFRGFGRVDQLDTERLSEEFQLPGLHEDTSGFDPVPPERYMAPLLSRTWFHLGPIGDEFDAGGDAATRREADISGEFWPLDEQVLRRPEATAQLLVELETEPGRQADALRSLRGRVVRTETFALDGSAREDRPFTVTESQYGIRDLADARRAFFPHLVSHRTTEWERGQDPMTTFAFTEEHDGYGLPVRQIDLAVPRGRDFRAAAAGGSPYLGAQTVTRHAQRDDPAGYLVDRVASVTVHEVRNDGAPSITELLDELRAGDGDLAVVGQTVHHYDGEAFTGLPLGQLGAFGALVRSERLVLTDTLLRAAYRGEGGSRPDVPPYLDAGAPVWPAEYPQAFRAGVPVRAGYSLVGQDDADRVPGYLMATLRQRYDFHDRSPNRPRGLVTVRRDPLGQDTTIGYDRFGLLPVTVVDAAGLTTRAVYDERALQPVLITDPNGNRTEAGYTPLGLLERVAVLGSTTEPLGDTLDAPTVRHSYDFAPGPRRPISVTTVRRLEHRGALIERENARRSAAGRPLLSAAEIAAEFGPAELATHPERFSATVEFSDGFGRLIQTRTQAEDTIFGDPELGRDVLPAAQDDPSTQQDVVGVRNSDQQRPNTVVSGAQRYDNKGLVVERFEPFFSVGAGWTPLPDARRGQRTVMFYDARGRAIRTVSPDGAEHRVVYGVPTDLTDADRFDPTPWESYSYDANDNAGRTHPDDARSYSHHWDTPTSTVLDPLGRTVSSTERQRAAPAGPGDPLPAIEELRTEFAYDIRGNLVAVIDPLGRVAVDQLYDLVDRPWRSMSIDAGVRWAVLDACGNEIEHRDGKGALVLHVYDVLHRPVRVWARDHGAGPVGLRQRMRYGDGGRPDQPAAQRAENRAANRLGRPHLHHDEAGLVTFVRYDFKGNVVDSTRRVISDNAILASFPRRDDPAPDWRIRAFHADWPAADDAADEFLDAGSYETSTSYDALNRVTGVRCPRDVDGGRRQLLARFNRAGAVERIELDGVAVVEHVGYTAGGAPTVIALGNGVLTRHAYDPQTFRVIRSRSERCTSIAGDAPGYRPVGSPLLDVAYTYDLNGNIVLTAERTPGCGVRANPEASQIPDPQLRIMISRGDALLRRFGYDPLNQLVSATGRQCIDSEQPRPWADQPGCGFNSPGHGTPDQANAPALTGVYSDSYQYDSVGNLRRARRAVATSGSVRELTPSAGSNRLETLTAGSTVFRYRHDASGNLVAEADSRHFEWDHQDRLAVFRTQAGDAEPSVYAHYLYDAAGSRVKKLVRRQGGGLTSTTYIGDHFEHHRWPAGENNLLHAMADQRRIALTRVGPPHPDDRGPATQFSLSEQPAGCTIVIDQDGEFINREEHTPFGETSFGGFARKRFRFAGKERDEESGLSFHAARYYAPWLGRWMSTDPAGAVDGWNLYRFVRNNPISFTDPSGRQAEEEKGGTEAVSKATDVGGAIVDAAKNKAERGVEEAEKRSRTTHSKPGQGSGRKKGSGPRKGPADRSWARAHERKAARATASRLTRLARSLDRAGKVLDLVGAAAVAAGKLSDSPTQTTAGRATDAALSAVVDTIYGSVNPALAAVDALQEMVFDAKPVPISDTLSGSVSAGVTAGEAVVTGSLGGVERAAADLRAGKHGWVLQRSVQAGDRRAEGAAGDRAISTGEGWDDLGAPGFVSRGAAFAGALPGFGEAGEAIGSSVGWLVERVSGGHERALFPANAAWRPK